MQRIHERNQVTEAKEEELPPPNGYGLGDWLGQMFWCARLVPVVY